MYSQKPLIKSQCWFDCYTHHINEDTLCLLKIGMEAIIMWLYMMWLLSDHFVIQSHPSLQSALYIRRITSEYRLEIEKTVKMSLFLVILHECFKRNVLSFALSFNIFFWEKIQEQEFYSSEWRSVEGSHLVWILNICGWGSSSCGGKCQSNKALSSCHWFLLLPSHQFFLQCIQEF